MSPAKPSRHDTGPGASNTLAHKVFAGLFGIWLAISLAKFGNPVVLNKLLIAPGSFWEWIFNAWPIEWGFWMFLPVLLCGVLAARGRPGVPKWMLLAPAIWLGWQGLSALNSVSPSLSGVTWVHFAVCTACFYLGIFALGHRIESKGFWLPVLISFGWILWMGFDQRFGGLEATRRMIHEQADWASLPPEYQRRLASDRIFSTFIYANALAGAILLLLPPLVVFLRRALQRRGNIPLGVGLGTLAYAGVACLVWSGSKSGWLIALVLVCVAFLHLSLSRRLKLGVAVLVLVSGIAVFLVRYQGYFERGATSVGARFDYWKAAMTVAKSNPLLGTGPGTFSIPYASIKSSESEMTRLVHNDYLEQASDSGIPGFLTYFSVILGSMGLLYRQCRLETFRLAIWLGLLGWCLQGFVEFGLYIPALSWPAFTLLGSLWGAGSTAFEIKPIPRRN